MGSSEFVENGGKSDHTLIRGQEAVECVRTGGTSDRTTISMGFETVQNGGTANFTVIDKAIMHLTGKCIIGTKIELARENKPCT